MLAADALFDYDALALFYDAGTAPGTAAATLSAAIKGDANNQCAGLEATWAVADHTFNATKAAMKAALDMGINATTDTQNAFIAALVAANFTTESFAGASAQVVGKTPADSSMLVLLDLGPFCAPLLSRISPKMLALILRRLALMLKLLLLVTPQQQMRITDLVPFCFWHKSADFEPFTKDIDGTTLACALGPACATTDITEHLEGNCLSLL